MEKQLSDGYDKGATADDEPAEENSGNDFEPECGVRRFKPQALKKCASVATFTGVYSVCGLLTSTLTTYVNSQVTTLEKHFGLSSAQSGLILAANEVGFLLVVLFVSYIASQVHIPRSLGFLTVLFGVSGMVCALPYFLFGAPSYGSDVTVNATLLTPTSVTRPAFAGQLCGINNTLSAACDVTTESDNTPHVTNNARANAGAALVILVIGMVLQGVAKAPRTPFSTTFVDDNIDKNKTGFYVGIMLTVSLLGPALAFGLGGLFSRYYVTLDGTNLHPLHPRWIGAWWLGFITFGFAACVFALPLFCFPRHIKQQTTRRTARRSADTRQAGNVLLKYIKALVVLFAACLGTYVGGYVTKRFKMRTMACVKFVCVVQLLSTVFTILSLACKCQQPSIYNSPGPRAITDDAMIGCYDNCTCDNDDFFPVCDRDGRTFFSPCHAGCTVNVDNTYTNCTCLPDHVATAGMCDYSCNMFYALLAVFCLRAISGTALVPPKVLIFIRSTEDRDKSLALGFVTFLTSLTGWMIAPLVFGKLIDDICIQWENPEDSCTGRGACLLYDNDVFRWKLMGYVSLFQFVSLICTILALVAAVLKRDTFRIHDAKENGDDVKNDNNVDEAENMM